MLAPLKPLPTSCNMIQDSGLNWLLSPPLLDGDIMTPSLLLQVYSLTWLSLLVRRVGAHWLSAWKAGADEAKGVCEPLRSSLWRPPSCPA